MSSRDLSAVVKTQKAFIKELLDRLEGQAQRQLAEEPIQNTELQNTECLVMNVQGQAYFLHTIEVALNDEYFKGLNLEQILELAKKSIRLLAENRKLQDTIQNIAKEKLWQTEE